MADIANLNVRGSNRLLALLRPEQRQTILSRTQKVDIKMRQALLKAERRITHVFFPLHGVISLTVILEDGVVAEAGTIGNEGLVGLPVLLGDTQAPTEAFCQVPGTCLRMRAEEFLEEIDRDLQFRDIAHRYALGFFHQVAQAAACNRSHPVEQRLCRRLLMTHDRVGEDRLPLTQEFLGQMLGVRRASVNLVLSVLQRAGFVRHRRGVIEILDRAGLQASCCGCYAAIQREYKRLLC
jgi:CRP-like cAMP-binding protein